MQKEKGEFCMTKKYICPCCGQHTLLEEPPGTYEICSVCGWEDDEIQYNNPNYIGGANKISLKEAQLQYKLKNNKV